MANDYPVLDDLVRDLLAGCCSDKVLTEEEVRMVECFRGFKGLLKHRGVFSWSTRPHPRKSRPPKKKPSPFSVTFGDGQDVSPPVGNL